MTCPELELFKKQSVNRPPATSILTSLLASPKTTCSSPDLTSPSDVFSESDLGSHSTSPSPQTRTPPRKACVSFAAAQPKSSPINSRPKSPKRPPLPRSPVKKSPVPARHGGSKTISSSPSKESQQIADSHPILGSVFDEFEESHASPVFHDYYRSGQPKKLVDDCLKKEKELRIPTISEEVDNSFKDSTSIAGTDIDDDDDDENRSESNDGEDNDKEPSVDGNEDSDKENAADRLLSRNHFQIDIYAANLALPAYTVYTPSRDVIDNFVPGTLDEDQLDILDALVSTQSVHDIDPTYPSEDDGDVERHSEQSIPLLVSPVRFISRLRGSPPLQLKFSASQIRSKGLSRTPSLQRNQKRYGIHLKRPSPKTYHSDQPRCAAIAIAKSMDHKRYHRREKREDPSESNQEKGLGVFAMAAMAKQLTSRNNLGLLAVSV